MTSFTNGLLLKSSPCCSLNSIAKKTGDSAGPNTSGHRGHNSCNFCHIRVNVTHDFSVTTFEIEPGQTHVNYKCSGLDKFGPEKKLVVEKGKILKYSLNRVVYIGLFLVFCMPFHTVDYSGDPKSEHLNTGNIRKPNILEVGLYHSKTGLEMYGFRMVPLA